MSNQLLITPVTLNIYCFQPLNWTILQTSEMKWSVYLNLRNQKITTKRRGSSLNSGSNECPAIHFMKQRIVQCRNDYLIYYTFLYYNCTRAPFPPVSSLSFWVEALLYELSWRTVSTWDHRFQSLGLITDHQDHTSYTFLHDCSIDHQIYQNRFLFSFSY